MSAITQGVVATATAAVKVFTATNGGNVIITNEDASIAVFVGGSTVTNTGATAGPKLAAGARITIPVKRGAEVWVASASGTPNVSFLFA